MGGGGGKTPKCTDRKKSTCNLYARASEAQASASETYFQVSKSMQFPFIILVVWRYKRQYIEKKLTLRTVYEYASLESFRVLTF